MNKILIISLCFLVTNLYSNDSNEVLKINEHYSLVEQKDKYGIWDSKSENFIIQPNYEFYKDWTAGQLLILKNKKREGVIFSMNNPNNYLKVSGLIKIAIDTKNRGYKIENKYYDSLLSATDSIDFENNRDNVYEEYFSNKKEIIYKYTKAERQEFEDSFYLSYFDIYDQYNFKQKLRDIEKYPEGFEVYQQSEDLIYIHYPNDKDLEERDKDFNEYLNIYQQINYEVYTVTSNRKKYITSFKVFIGKLLEINTNQLYYIPYFDFFCNSMEYEITSNTIKKLLQQKGYKVDDLMIYNNGQFTFKSKGKWGGGVLDVSSSLKVTFHISVEPQFEFSVSQPSGGFIVFDKDNGIGFYRKHFAMKNGDSYYVTTDTVLFREKPSFTDSSFNYKYSHTSYMNETRNSVSPFVDFYAFYDTTSEKLHFKSTSVGKYGVGIDSYMDYNIVGFNWLDINFHFDDYGREDTIIYVKDAFQSMDDSTIQALGIKNNKDPEVVFENYIEQYNSVLNEAHQNMFKDNSSHFNQKMTDTYTGVFNLKNNKIEHFYNYDIYKADVNYTLEPLIKVGYNKDVEFDSLTLSDVYFDFSLEYNQRDENLDIVEKNVDDENVYHTYEEHDLLRKSFDNKLLYSYKDNKVSIINRYLPRRESDFYDLIYKYYHHSKEYRINQDTLYILFRRKTYEIPLPSSDSLKLFNSFDYRYQLGDFFLLTKNDKAKKYKEYYDEENEEIKLIEVDSFSVEQFNKEFENMNYDSEKGLVFDFHDGYLVIDQSRTVGKSISFDDFGKGKLSNQKMNSSELYKITENGYKFLMEDFFTLDRKQDLFIASKVVGNMGTFNKETYDGFNTYSVEVKYNLQYELYNKDLDKLEAPVHWMKSDSSATMIKLKDLKTKDFSDQNASKMKCKYLTFRHNDNFVLYDTELSKVILESDQMINPNDVDVKEITIDD